MLRCAIFSNALIWRLCAALRKPCALLNGQFQIFNSRQVELILLDDPACLTAEVHQNAYRTKERCA
jgi:hypothetical protein